MEIGSTIKRVCFRFVDFVKRHKKFWAVVMAVLFFSLGFLICKLNKETKTVQTITETKEVKIPVKGETKTVVQYVPKESAHDADVNITNPAPVVVMKYNDKEYDLPTVQNEEHKFDKGKLDVQSETKTTLDVTPIVKEEVNSAVKANTEELTKQMNAEMDKIKKEDKKEKRKTALESFLIGAGTGLAVGMIHK